MKVALHRSLNFWSGILAMGFISLGWRDSLKYESCVEGSGWYADNSAGAVTLAWQSGRIAEPYSSSRWEFWEGTRIPGSMRLPIWIRGGERSFRDFAEVEQVSSESIGEVNSAALRLSFPHKPSSDFYLLIPHWLILAAVAVPWLSLLIWKVRRRKRAGRSSGN